MQYEGQTKLVEELRRRLVELKESIAAGKAEMRKLADRMPTAERTMLTQTAATVADAVETGVYYISSGAGNGMPTPTAWVLVQFVYTYASGLKRYIRICMDLPPTRLYRSGDKGEPEWKDWDTDKTQIRTGTKTVAASGNGSYHTLFTSAQLNTLFGTTGVTYDASNTTVVAVNGGYTDVQKIFAIAYSSSTGVWYVRTADGSNFPAANLTVNYIVTTW